MPQKPTKFQSKTRRDGGNFSARGGSADSRGERGGKGGFPKRFEGDKPRAPRADKKFDGEKKYGPKKFDGEKKFGDRKFGDKKFDGEKKYGPKKFDGEKKFGDRKFGDKKFEGEKKYGPKKFDGEKKFGDRKFGDKKFSDRPQRRDYAERDHVRQPVSDETRNKLKSARPNYGAPSPAYLYGVHPVTQALLNVDRKHSRLLVTERGLASLEKTLRQMDKDGLVRPPVTTVESEDISRLLPRDAVHQDVLLDTLPLEEVFLQDVLLHTGDDACVVVLDQVTDPHNVGAILRSAAAFGALAVVVQKLHAPEITGVLAKSASGAVEHVPVVREVNLSRTLAQLKDAGFTCIGLAERGDLTLAESAPRGKVAVVLGAEGDGLRRLVAENCDQLVRLPTQGEIASLNVSNAAAVALYELARLRA